MTTFHVVTLFPESLDSYLNASIVKRAQEKKLIDIKFYNPRDYVKVKGKRGKGKGQKELTYSDKRVDNKPYGGGPGMVIEALPVIRAIERALKGKGKKEKGKTKIVFFSPAGKQFTNAVADSYKKYTDIVFVCGRYEGIDARVKKAFPMVDITVGPYVLTGGELPAMIMIDTITRRIDGVLGDKLSIEEERIASPDVYTRPATIEYKKKKYNVPKVLLNGNHVLIQKWKEGRKSNP